MRTSSVWTAGVMLGAVLGLPACAPPMQQAIRPEPIMVTPAMSPGTPEQFKAAREAPVPIDKSRLFLARAAGTGQAVIVALNETPIARLAANEFTFLDLAPGVYQVTYHWAGSPRLRYRTELSFGARRSYLLNFTDGSDRPTLRPGDMAELTGGAYLVSGVNLAVLRPFRAAPPEPPRSGTGSGFYVDAGGRVLTNKHVVDGCKELFVKQPEAEARTAKVEKLDGEHDLALLQTGKPAPAVAPLSDGPARMGGNVVVFGYPLSPLLASSGVVTTGIVNALSGIGNDTNLLQISAEVQSGNSGGPVLDPRGNVIGVVVGKLGMLPKDSRRVEVTQNVNFAIKIEHARALLAQNGVTPEAGTRKSDLDTARITDLARRFTVQVECK